MAAKQLKNFVQHKLTVQPLAGDTVLTWDSVSGWPTVGDFPIRLDSVDLLTNEIVLCTSVNVGANQTTVVRAQEGTSASGLFVINSTGGNDLTAQMMADLAARLDITTAQTLVGPLLIPYVVGTAPATTPYASFPIRIGKITGTTCSFTPIPANFDFLKLRAMVRSDQAADQVVSIRFNNDATAIYDYELATDTNTTVSASGSVTQTSARVGVAPGTGIQANVWNYIDIDIDFYANTVAYKAFRAYMARRTGAGVPVVGDMLTEWNTGWWRNAAAITRVDLIVPAGAFNANSIFLLYGG